MIFPQRSLGSRNSVAGLDSVINWCCWVDGSLDNSNGSEPNTTKLITRPYLNHPPAFLCSFSFFSLCFDRSQSLDRESRRFFISRVRYRGRRCVVGVIGTHKCHSGVVSCSRESEPDFGPPLPIPNYEHEFYRVARGVCFVCYFKRCDPTTPNSHSRPQSLFWSKGGLFLFNARKFHSVNSPSTFLWRSVPRPFRVSCLGPRQDVHANQESHNTSVTH